MLNNYITYINGIKANYEDIQELNYMLKQGKTRLKRYAFINNNKYLETTC